MSVPEFKYNVSERAGVLIGNWAEERSMKEFTGVGR